MILPVHPALVGLTLRQTLARRRWVLLVILAAIPMAVAAALQAYATPDDDPVHMVIGGLSALIVTGIVPIVALILSNAALGSEVDDGTLIYLLTKPVPRWQIVTSKLLTTSLLAALTTMVATFGAGVLAMRGLDETRLVLGFTAGVGVGSILYTAIFLALSLITRRGMLVGLIYLIVWEGAFSGYFAGTRTLSVRQYMLSIADRISTVNPDDFTALLPFGTAWQMSLVVGLGATALAIARLRRFELDKAG